MNRTPMSQSYVNSQAGGAGQQEQQAAGSSGGNNMTQQQQQQQQDQASSQQQAAAAAAASNFQQQQTMNMMIGSSGEQMSQMTSLLLEFAFSAFVNKPTDIVEYAAQYFAQLNSQRNAPSSQQQQQQQRSGDSNSKRVSSDSQRSNLSQTSSSFNTNNNNNNNNNADQQTTTMTTTTTKNNGNNNSSYGQASEDEEFDTYDQQQQQQQSGPASRLVNFNTQQQQQQQAPVRGSYSRRKSVFAEAYDPAADQEDDENNRVVHGKTDEQRHRLSKAIKSIFLFRSVDPQDMTQILDAMFEVKVSPGDVVIRQGDDGDNFYVVERGKFQIYCTQDDGQKQVRGEYENNGSFGELALMYNQPRAATVIALSEGSLWAMDRKTFRRIVLKSAFKKRKEYEALFEKVSVLQCLNGYERMNLCDALESKRFLNGQMIIVQGDQANGMYFIESGNVKIVKQMEDGRVIDVAILGKGDYFGELALINHKPRAASVYAMGDDVKLAFLDVKAFERLLGSCIERMEKNCAMYLSELAHQEGRQNV